MTPEQFDLTVKHIRGKIDTFLKDINQDRDFDVPDPIFFLCDHNPEENVSGMVVFNQEKFFPGIDEAPPQFIAQFMRKFFVEMADEQPDLYHKVASAVFTGGWQKDPKTGERLGEILSLCVEDADRNMHTAIWNMERPEEGPVKLTMSIDNTVHNYPYEAAGAMQNLFDHPPLSSLQEDKVN